MDQPLVFFALLSVSAHNLLFAGVVVASFLPLTNTTGPWR